MKKVLFYSSVKTKKLFSIQSYYRNDILILRELGYKVILSKSICDFLCFWRYDIAYLFFYRYSLFSAFLAKLFGKKVYFTGGIDYLDRTFATRRQRIIQGVFFKLCNIFSDTNIIVSHADLENITRLYKGKCPSKCKLCFHVVDVKAMAYRGDFQSKTKRFVTIAWMLRKDNVYRKGIDKAVRVFAAVHKVFPEYTFSIAGPMGEGSDYVQMLIDELHLNDSVKLLGTITEEEKIQLLQTSRFYFQLSTYEGFGIAAAEALAAGNILIHSGRGGLRDAAGPFGYVVDIDNEQNIIRCVLDLCKREISNQQMNDGIRYVEQMFSYQQRMDFLNGILNK